jgi:Zn-dependent protease with chaperone function
MEDVLVASLVLQILLYIYMMFFLVWLQWFPKTEIPYFKLITFVLFGIIGLVCIILTGVA